MNPKNMMRQMFDFNRTAFEKSYSVMLAMQEQMEKLFSLWLDRNQLLPEQGKKAFSEWMTTCKANRDECKAKIDEGYASMEGYFSGLEK